MATEDFRNPMANRDHKMEDLIEQANEIQESQGHSCIVPDELGEADLAYSTYQSSIYAVSPVEQQVADASRMGGTNQVGYELGTRATRGFLL
jgi:hypothetical protein